MVDDAVLSEIRAQLEGEREHLRGQLGELVPGTETSLTFDENFADSGQVAAELGEAQALAGPLLTQLADVEAALDKLGDGSYGRCEECGRPIGDARLEAMPHTRFCIDHA
ncbi:MAG: TraR/DksA C4-type zinc finger protein [Acidimicrobiales bacterium]|nr:TraR/DksA C4-type zinc finger protein [Acidimicrobiales bacterium]MCB1014626.1 TraR/DksA C4-type zinc finger protein [Acidimicrobiales bacterium]MCB9371376.1 TraR/DksA C4-type zinc finger protein [Microthrixaceae bacterium]